jgi:hypothetical protein
MDYPQAFSVPEARPGDCARAWFVRSACLAGGVVTWWWPIAAVRGSHVSWLVRKDTSRLTGAGVAEVPGAPAIRGPRGGRESDVPPRSRSRPAVDRCRWHGGYGVAGRWPARQV